jgi:4-methyl-5(b-hydroxyethyl)-thiazole monophosphate biosynthesis
MTYVFLAGGAAEIEAVAIIDILRRAGVDVKTVGLTSDVVTGARGIKLTPDMTVGEITAGYEMLVVPGGLKGVETLADSLGVRSLIKSSVLTDTPVGAICAAPVMFAKMGLLKGRTVTCHPSVAEEVAKGGAYVLDRPWVREGNLITGQGAGASLVFAIALVSLLKGDEAADKLAEELKVSWR